MLNIERIGFYFDNDENEIIPIECFRNLIIDFDKTKIKLFKCTIVDNGNIETEFNNNFVSPINRFIQKDLCGIEIYFKDGTMSTLDLPCEEYDNTEEDTWGYDSIRDYSCNQHTKQTSYKEIELYIADNSKEYSLQEALEQLKDGDIIIDSKGNEYHIFQDENGDNCLVEGIIKLSLLNEKFTKKMIDND